MGWPEICFWSGPHEPMWRESKLWTSQGSSVKHRQIIQRLLEGGELPWKVTVMHHKAHQFGETPVNIRNTDWQIGQRGCQWRHPVALTQKILGFGQGGCWLSDWKWEIGKIVRCWKESWRMVNYTQQTHNNSPTPYEENGGETKEGCSLGNRVYGRSIEISSFEHMNDWYNKSIVKKCQICLKKKAH